jgi:nifR3 family TIM-barrel protein
VSVKHRAGWDERHLNAPEFACAMVEAGAAMITVHGRTRAQGFSGRSDRVIIKRVRAAVPRHVPVVGNGDVITVDDYFRMREETGCDAVMIGRGAMGNPWLFRSIRERLAGNEDPGPPDVSERARVFSRHMDYITAHAPEKKLVHELRKAVAWYTKGLRGSAHVREQAWNVGASQVREIALGYFSSLLQEKNSPTVARTIVDKLHAEVA